MRTKVELHKPNRMLNKIHNSIKRNYNLYDRGKYSYYGSAKTPRLLEDVSPETVEHALKYITTHLWYAHCGMTKQELYALVEQEYQAFKLIELIGA